MESLWPELLCEVPRVPAAGPTPADLRQQITFIYTDDLAASEKFYSEHCCMFNRPLSGPAATATEVCACLAVETMGLPLVGSESEPGEMRLFQVSENGLVRLSTTRPLAVDLQRPD